ncbi:hypothetical protein FQR65_LT09549 [Abscondita terminalis]|nr:hypothetical protein FQR65_LT09549 [Abscondita terminalis]
MTAKKIISKDDVLQDSQINNDVEQIDLDAPESPQISNNDDTPSTSRSGTPMREVRKVAGICRPKKCTKSGGRKTKI